MKRVCLMVLLAGCAVDKPMPAEDFSDLSGVDEKSDYFSSRLRLLGALEEGKTRRVYYTSSPTFRGYKIVGAEALDLWVRADSDSGDSVAWLLDSHFHVVKKNDDADETTYDSHLKATVKADQTYYLVLRDYNLESGWFTIERARAASPALKCSGSGLIATVPDDCMDDGGVNGAGDALEVYCFKNVARFCLSGEACAWRKQLPSSDNGATCSRGGLGTDSPESQEYGLDFMAHTWCSQWQGHEWIRCASDAQVHFE